jgi:hypothetical protein
MSNCNSSNIIDIPQAFNGSDGTSAYVYIAYATTVTAGSPDTVTGFSNNVPTGASEWIGIITTNTPITTPVATDFDNHWFNFKGAPGLPGVNLENFNVAVAGGPFTTLNFLAAGLTGVTVTNSGGGEAAINIVTASFNKTYRNDFLTLIGIGALVPGASYWIVDAGDGEQTGIADMPAGYYGLTGNTFLTYPHSAGIMVRAVSTNAIDPTGIFLGRVPKRTSPTVNLFELGTAYTANVSYVENYNEVYLYSANTAPTSLEPAEDPGNWDFITKDNSTYYITDVQNCTYNVTTNTVVARWDNKGNYLQNLNTTGTNEIIKKCFRWGTTNVVGNKIHFYDDSTKNTLARVPVYGNLLTNYSGVGTMLYNDIDTNYSKATLLTNIKVGTRFFQNKLKNSTLISNKISNAVISNIDDRTVAAMMISNNTIDTSVINNVNFTRFFDNIITDNTVIGDILYGTVTSGTSNLQILPDVTFNTILNEYIIYNLGCKTWSAVGNSTSTVTNPGTTPTITLNNTITPVTYLDNIGEYVYFTGTTNTELNGKYKLVTGNGGSPTLNIFTIAGTLTSTYTGAMSCYFIHPSIKTSFYQFAGNNISSSIIRGLNKSATTGVANTLCIKNTISNSFLENYVNHTQTLTGNFDSYYNNPGNEIGGDSFVGAVGFAKNEIVDSAFRSNKIVQFYTNEIKGVYFFNNGNSGGFQGPFYANKLVGNGKVMTLSGRSFIRGFNAPGTPSVYFTNNNFNANSYFISNIVTDNNKLDTVTLNAYTRLAACKFTASLSPTISTFSNESYTGLFNVQLVAGTSTSDINDVSGLVFEGRHAGMSYLKITKSGYKEVIGPASFSGLVFRDLRMYNTFTEPSDTFNPVLFGGGPSTSIRNITYAEQAYSAGTDAVTIGGNTYKRARYWLTITTQAPHFLNGTAVGTSIGLSILNGGFTWKYVYDGQFDATLPTPNGKYSTPATPSNQFGFTGIIKSITNEFTFVAEIQTALTSNYYHLLHSTNTTVDGNGTAAPGAGITGGPFSDSYGDYLDLPHKAMDYRNTYAYNTPSQDSSLITLNSSDTVTRLSLLFSSYPPAASPTGTRNFYAYYNYTAGTSKLYDSATNTLTLPKHITKLGGTIMFGSHTSGTYQISFIGNLTEGVPVRFITTPGCDVQFNLTAVASFATNAIMKDSAAASYTIKGYGTSSSYLYDEIVIMRQNGTIKIISKVIHQ